MNKKRDIFHKILKEYFNQRMKLHFALPQTNFRYKKYFSKISNKDEVCKKNVWISNITRKKLSDICRYFSTPRVLIAR